jgi:hypothetical protein
LATAGRSGGGGLDGGLDGAGPGANGGVSGARFAGGGRWCRRSGHRPRVAPARGAVLGGSSGLGGGAAPDGAGQGGAGGAQCPDTDGDGASDCDEAVTS